MLWFAAAFLFQRLRLLPAVGDGHQLPARIECQIGVFSQAEGVLWVMKDS
ncbi:hypothetical protein [Pectobacterium brasiliense]|nr:hypothetical protein [Pectobacterium brasiliense]WJM81190.1 hypothetical protein QTI90_24040 [Pectobacterium brasiliense]